MTNLHLWNPNAINIMLDLETLGTTPGCKILSIGACTFDPYRTSTIPRQVTYLKIDRYAGQILLEEAPETVAWWEKQDQTARDEAFSGTWDLDDALKSFSNWIENLKLLYNEEQINIWGKGKDFDEPILDFAYKINSLTPNWKTENSYCFRHMISDKIHTLQKFPFEGTVHNALHDALHQAKWAEAICRELTAWAMLEVSLNTYHECLPYGQ